MTFPQFARRTQRLNETRGPGKVPPKAAADNEQKKEGLLVPQAKWKKERSKTASNMRDAKPLATVRQKLPEKKEAAKTVRKEAKKAAVEPRKTFTKDVKKTQKKPPVTGTSRNANIVKAYHTQASPSEKLIETRKLVDFNRKDFEFVDTASVLSPTFANKLKEEGKKILIGEEFEAGLLKLKQCYLNDSLEEMLKEKTITQEQASALLKDLEEKVAAVEKEIKDLGTKELPKIELEGSDEKVTADSLFASKPLPPDTIQGLRILLGILSQWEIVEAADVSTFAEKTQEYLKANAKDDLPAYLHEKNHQKNFLTNRRGHKKAKEYD
eukprot:TRINITY_DN5497_c0_g1_i2.p1 TRINITY_DN5497_c0_g1~~TRINITY_DN5497_c0_g1_i2.p1  ORF type:complete len:325 (-),score=94.11 TRINITY_DN5497_c0_g1_i2:293-1267(-)